MEKKKKKTLATLPQELIDNILGFLPRQDLKDFSLTCRWAHDNAISSIWCNVELTDCRKHYLPGSSVFQQAVADPNAMPDRIFELDDDDPLEYTDDHDDSPMIRKLVVLAENPQIASKVRTLIHRCHLPPPNVFSELPQLSCNGQTLSQDPRTHELLRLAILNMVNVNNLYIIHGHWHLTVGLVSGFFHKFRPCDSPVRRLWIEGSTLESLYQYDPWTAAFAGLESIRLRRVYMTESPRGDRSFALGRGGHTKSMCNGAAGFYQTSIHDSNAASSSDEKALALLGGLPAAPVRFDNAIYDDIPRAKQLLTQTMTKSCSLPFYDWTRKMTHDWKGRACLTNRVSSPMTAALGLLQTARESLTSLNLDWVLWNENSMVKLNDLVLNREAQQDFFLKSLASLRFPKLKSLQLRNATGSKPMSNLVAQIYLFDPAPRDPDSSFLSFLEYHCKLVNLAWPIDKFFSHRKSSSATHNARVDAVIENLSNNLIGLRLDATTDHHERGEPLTDDPITIPAMEAQARRHRVIAEFAPRMKNITTFKVEGGVPRDEKRELVRALHQCPLEKLVMIGISCPLGNTWGLDANEIAQVDPFAQDTMEEENKEFFLNGFRQAPVRLDPDYKFEPAYGWRSSLPMMHSVAQCHAETIRELKFCGYYGAPTLGIKTEIEDAVLSGLCYCHKLEDLIISMWLPTWFDARYRDDAIVNYWTDVRDEASEVFATRKALGLNRITPAWYGPANHERSREFADIRDLQNLQRVSRDHDPREYDWNDSSSEIFPLDYEASPADLADNPPDANGNVPAPRPQTYHNFISQSPITEQPLYTALAHFFHPARLAQHVGRLIWPHLSPVARARKGGVTIKASFCLGEITSDIFEFEVRVGYEGEEKDEEGDKEEGGKERVAKVLSILGPKEEGERERRKEKLETREWF
ncbi:hypothetical protein K402DRAFT_406558 [Aulographum hederae CBS 113979]|uniref:F-box domain-containing protein n=1 Tax=Aulographum hederae CBS 113979 TaxID=1176131 RepID=A0A6G1GSA4_9PEZI|nr:hypothetical protein K402DRAFT_406558 [Aulographum hederae CBS 113979]